MTNRTKQIKTRIAVILLSGLLSVSAQGKPKRLGPTGLFGSAHKKTIKVTQIDKGSPADGKVKKDDVIIGVNGAPFEGNPYRDFAVAIDISETRKAGGKMTLTLKDNREVAIKLRVLGSYSETAPYNCEKTDTIISLIAESLLKSNKAGAGATRSGVLGLMATGEKKYMDAAAKMVKGMGKVDPAMIDDVLLGKTDQGYVGWFWGYTLITLGEYYLLTEDASVLPAIRTYALGLARGQDGGGMWAHRMATTGTSDRSRNGRLPGYGQINQPSLTCFMGLLIAEKCGIDDPVLKKGIEKTYARYANCIGKGALGYGVGSGTDKYFNNNGTSGSTAICMGLKGNNEGAQFFSQMASTTYDDLEQGHASAFFNPLWTPLGAHVSGPYVTQQFFRKSLWYHNLKRRWDGGYGSDRKEGPEAGVALLNYCLPRRALLITGREADKSNWLKRDEATKVVMMSKMDYNAMGNEELMTLMMETPFSRVRRSARYALMKGRTDEQRKELVPKLEAYLKTGTDAQKRLALSQYRSHTPLAEKQHLLKDIGATVRDTNASLETRVAAVESLGYHFKEMAYPYYMDIVKLIAQERPDDPFGDIDQSLTRSLHGICGKPFAAGLVTDKDIFYKAVNKVMRHKRDRVIAEGVWMLSDMPLEDFHYVGDRILHIAKNNDPTMHHYHPLHAVKASLELLARFNIEEGIDCLQNEIFKGGRYPNEIKVVYGVLPKYGSHAKKAVDTLEKKKPEIKRGRFGKHWLKAAKAIREDKNPEKLITFKEAMRAGK